MVQILGGLQAGWKRHCLRTGVLAWVQTGCAGLVMSNWVLLRNLAHCSWREPRINLLPWKLHRWRRPGDQGRCWWQWHSHRVRRGWKPAGLELSRATKNNVAIEISLVGGWKRRGTWLRKAVSGNGRSKETFFSSFLHLWRRLLNQV